MKHQAINLLKFKMLSRRLKLPLWQGVGLLESLWLFAQHNARHGDLTAFGADGIACWLEWEGDPGELVDALVETCWLEREGERLTIHDWDEHKPNWVKGMAASPVTKPRTPSATPSATLSVTPSAALAATPPSPPLPNLTKEEGVPPPSLEEEPLKPAVADWLRHKVETGKRYKPTGLRKFFSRVDNVAAKYGPRHVCDLIEKAIGNGWTGWEHDVGVGAVIDPKSKLPTEEENQAWRP